MKPVFQHWRENLDKVPLLHSILKCADKINFEVNQDACAAFPSHCPSPCLYSETSETTVGNSLKICFSHIQSKESGSVPRTERFQYRWASLSSDMIRRARSSPHPPFISNEGSMKPPRSLPCHGFTFCHPNSITSPQLPNNIRLKEIRPLRQWKTYLSYCTLPLPLKKADTSFFFFPCQSSCSISTVCSFCGCLRVLKC